MVYMNIKCGSCGGSWTVYDHEDWKHWRARTCPHCKAKIDEQVYRNAVLTAFCECMDAEKELIKQHTGYHTPLFSVDIKSDSLFKNDDTHALKQLTEAVRGIETKLNRKRRKRK